MSTIEPVIPDGPAWAASFRSAAASRFEAQGIPTTRREDWRYTSLRRFKTERFTVAERPSDAALSGLALDSARCDGSVASLVFVDGHFVESLSRMPGSGAVSVSRLFGDREQVGFDSHGLDDAPFVALNTASAVDGLAIDIARGGLVDGHIEVLFVSSGAAANGASFPRLLVRAGAGSAAVVVERHLGGDDGAQLVCPVTELLADADANLKHVFVQEQGSDAFCFATISATPRRGAQIEQHTVSLGAGTARTAVHVKMLEAGAGCALKGVFAATGAQSLDHYTVMDHVVGHCTSSEVYKGLVASDDAVGSFLGRVLMREGAEKSGTDQLCRALLLSDGAKANVKPSLEIDNDDVTASHGAAIGRLDPEQVFFLRARGLTEPLARALLIEAFVAEVLSEIPVEGLGHTLTAQVARRILPGVAVEALD